MKVLHLNYYENYGGAAKAVNRIHQGLIREGIDSKILVVKKETKDKSIIEVSTLYSQKNKLFFLLKRLARKIKILVNLSDESLLINVLENIDFDILHLHWVSDGYVSFNELVKLNKPIVWTMHDCAAFTGICHVIGSCNNFLTECGNCPLINSNKKQDISHREFIRKKKLLKNLSVSYVSPSNWLASVASKSKLLDGSQISIIPHGLETDRYFPINKKVAKEALLIDVNVILVLSSAVTLKDSNKGFNLLSDALSYFKKTFKADSNIEVILLGEAEDKSKSVAFTTRYLGYVADELLLRILYSAADVIIVPSRQESFGQVAIEAMACGTPVVAFGATGLLDIIDHKKNGYLAKPYNTGDLAIGVKWCMDNNKDGLLSVNAREKALSSFGIKNCAQKYINLYKNLLPKENAS